MKNTNVLLREEIAELEKIICHTRNRVQRAPQGTLRISKKNTGIEYYSRSAKSGGNGKYIRKKDVEMAHKLAQKDYDIQLLKIAEERLRAIRHFLEVYDKTDLRKIYQKTNPYRRELLHEAILSDEEYIKWWQAVEYEGKAYAEDAPEIITEKGERVRSKSEKIIADKLYSLGIPYRYEYPLTLAGNVKIYPDFTILKMPAREEVYLEHFGMMDDGNYVDTVMYKLNTYERNGIYPGVNLFFTHETSRSPLNTRTLNEFIRKALDNEDGNV